MPTFSTDFTPPPAISGLSIEGDVSASAVRLSWDPTAIAEVDFRGYRVSRSRDQGITWELLATLAGVNDVEWADYLAPLNITLLYRVTQSNVDFESEPAEASVELDTPAWWIVVPGDTSLTFAIPRQQEADLETVKEQDVFRPMGRPGALVVGDVVRVEQGSIAFLALQDNLAVIELLRRVQARMEGELVMKASDGTVWTVQYGDLRRTFTRSGIQEVSIPFYGTG